MDGSGRQQWTIVSTPGGWTISSFTGRTNCSQVLAAGSCPKPSVALVAPGSGGLLESWSAIPFTPPTGGYQALADGLYYISSIGGVGCDNYLSAGN